MSDPGTRHSAKPKCGIKRDQDQAAAHDNRCSGRLYTRQESALGRGARGEHGQCPLGGRPGQPVVVDSVVVAGLKPQVVAGEGANRTRQAYECSRRAPPPHVRLDVAELLC